MASYIKKEDKELLRINPPEPSTFVNIERDFVTTNTGLTLLQSVSGSGTHDLLYGTLRLFPGSTGKSVIYLTATTTPGNYYAVQADYITGSSLITSQVGVTSSVPDSVDTDDLNILEIGSSKTDTMFTFKAETETSYIFISIENVGSVDTSLNVRWDGIGIMDVSIPKNLEVRSVNADPISTSFSPYERRSLTIEEDIDGKYIRFTAYSKAIGIYGQPPRLQIKGELK